MCKSKHQAIVGVTRVALVMSSLSQGPGYRKGIRGSAPPRGPLFGGVRDCQPVMTVIPCSSSSLSSLWIP